MVTVDFIQTTAIAASINGLMFYLMTRWASSFWKEKDKKEKQEEPGRCRCPGVYPGKCPFYLPPPGDGVTEDRKKSLEES